ncbi:MAG: type VI secretion system baseplate subunit TssK, partial [Alcanivorax sp.]|uniref:type VI secretion system baseplate subunit TssK n=1 Tax=Alcanivorax sp. TaxID=1872427 RepID=UPI003DA77A58
ADYQEVADEHDPSRTREIIVGKPNLSLLRGDESREHYSAFRLASFEQQGDGRYAQVESYVPPVVTLQGSEQLQAWMARIRDLLSARVRQLSQQRNSYGDIADMGSREMGQFLRLLQLRPALATLDHLIQQESSQPETLYREMLRLITGLRDFQPDMPELELPLYQHGDLGSVFTTLETLLRESLAQSAKTASTALSLNQESPALLLAEGVPWSNLDKQHLYLGVYHESEDPNWVTDFSRQAKSGSREDLELILASALPGIRLTHTQRPPNKLPVKSGFEYFRFEPSGEFWPRAMEAESLAVFLPGQFQGSRFELLCVED